MREKLKSFAEITGGTLLVIVGVYFFKFPNNFSTGGVSGISLIIARLLPQISPGTAVFCINMILLVVAFLFLGKKFGAKTVYCSLMLSIGLRLMEIIYPMSAPFTNQTFMELIFAVMLPAIGSAILFNNDASTGGTDVIAMILKKFTSINIGRALLISDSLIVLGACLVFGIETGLFCILGLAMKSLVVDNIIESFNLCKYFTIITEHPDEICQFIDSELKRSATLCNATGHFTGQPKTLVLTVVRRGEAIKLQRYAKMVDKGAFIMITNTSEIIGKGFRGAQ